MISRILVTLLMLFLTVYAFWGNAFDEGHFFNPFGVLFLALTITIWFKWEIIRDAFRTAKNESTLPIERLGFKILEGMRRRPRTERPSDELS
jgi:hypothetical protein